MTKEVEILTSIHKFKLRALETVRRIHGRFIESANKGADYVSASEVDKSYLQLFDAEIEALKAELELERYKEVRTFMNPPFGAEEGTPHPVTTRPRTVDELRTAVLSGIDWALTAPFLSRFISQDAKDLLHAQYTFWSSSTDVELARLLSNLQMEGTKS